MPPSPKTSPCVQIHMQYVTENSWPKGNYSKFVSSSSCENIQYRGYLLWWIRWYLQHTSGTVCYRIAQAMSCFHVPLSFHSPFEFYKYIQYLVIKYTPIPKWSQRHFFIGTNIQLSLFIFLIHFFGNTYATQPSGIRAESQH